MRDESLGAGGGTRLGADLEVQLGGEPDISVERASLPPVFIVGDAARRARLVAMLDHHPDISCSPESTFLWDVVKAAEDNFETLSRYGYPEQYWFTRIAGLYDSIQREYAASRGKSRWATEASEHEIDRVDRLFPTCQFLHVDWIRRPLFGPSRTAGRAGARLLPRRYLHVTTRDLDVAPEATMSRVLDFLDEGEDSSPREITPLP
jgi:hypothetical protein